MADSIGSDGKDGHGADAKGRAAALALTALAWLLSDDRRAERLLSLTGLTAEQLRERAGDPGLLAEVIAFLEGHEPDLVGAAEACGVEPGQLIEAKRMLMR